MLPPPPASCRRPPAPRELPRPAWAAGCLWIALAACSGDGTPLGPATADELHARARAAVVAFESARDQPPDTTGDTPAGGALAAAAAVEAAYAELLRVAPRAPGASLELGLFLVSRGDGAQAEPLLRHAVNLAPDDPDALRALGALLRAKGDLGEAAVVLQRAVNAGAIDHATRRALADVLTTMGDEPTRAAEAHLRAADTARISGDAASAVHDLLGAARAFRAAGDPARARDALTQVLALEPGQPTAVSELERLVD